MKDTEGRWSMTDDKAREMVGMKRDSPRIEGFCKMLCRLIG